MAHGFVEPDRDQLFLMPPSVREWLPPDHEVWFLIDVVDALDVVEFERAYRLGAQGRPPWSPRMLITLLVYCYSRGVESSRRIEMMCAQDVACRVICGNVVPDHSSIARFRAQHQERFKGLFTQVLGLCMRAGMVRLGLIALDGTKMAASASLGSNRSVEWLRAEVERIVDEAAATDAAEDDAYGDGRGDELPERVADPERRRRWLRETLAKADEEGLSRVNVIDPQSRVMSSTKGFVQGYNAQVIAAQGGVILAAEVTNDENDVHQLAPMLDALADTLEQIGMDEPVGTLLADAGYFSADNLDAVGERAIDALIAVGKTRDLPTDAASGDVDAYDAEQASIDAEVATERQRRVAIFERVYEGEDEIGDVLDELGLSQAAAYSHYRKWLNGDVDAIPVRRRRALWPKPTKAARARAAMIAKLADPANRERYKQRGHLAETIFAHTKHNRRSTRFHRRGLGAVSSEWTLSALVNNIMRLCTTMQAHTT